MNITYRITIRAAQRVVATLMVALLLAVGVLPLFDWNNSALAVGSQLTSRSIKLSDSGVSNNSSITSGVGSGTAVTYRFQFTITSTAHSLVVDFCSNSPIIGDTTCTTPASFIDASGAALSQVGSGVIGGTGWAGTFSTTQIKLHDDNAHAISTGDVTSGVETFDITGVTNPSQLGTFYARIYTYSNNSYGTYSGVANVASDNHLDFGGIALTTTVTITITARVQESLTFCVTGNGGGTGTAGDPSTWTTAGPNIHSCADPVVAANPPALVLGTGTPTPVLSATAVDLGNVYTQLSTNATNGAVIRMRNSNLNCGGLSANGGTSCAIPAANIAAANAVQSGATSGNAAFAMFGSNGEVDPGSGGGPTLNTVNAASCTADAHFNGGAGHQQADPNHSGDADTYYGMYYDNTNANGVTSTFGATVFSCSQPVYHVDNYYQFAVTPSLSTPAGIYTANLSLIATSTF